MCEGERSQTRDAMAEKLDKAVVQMKIRREAGFISDDLLDEELYRHCFIADDDAWTFRYGYAPTATSGDETIHSGHVLAKANKNGARFIEDREHRSAFWVRVRGRHDMDVVLNRTDETEI